MGTEGAYICGHNVLKAHARAYHIYDTEFRAKQKGQIGIVLPCQHYYSKDKSDTESSDVAFEFACGWFANPIFSKSGDYPKVMQERVLKHSESEGFLKSKLPTFSKKWIEYIR